MFGGYYNNNKLESIKDLIVNKWENEQNLLFACVKYVLRFPAPDTVQYLKENGQYISYGAATGKEMIDRDYSILDLQYQYFIKIIELCEAEGITLYVIMPPLWTGETASHSDQDRAKVDNLILDALSETPYSLNYINYSSLEGLSAYTDFIDVTHLTPSAADRYSKYINDIIFASEP